MVEVESGVEREVLIWKPKALSGSNNACLFYAHGGGCVMFHPADLRAQMIFMALQLNVVVVAPDYRLAPEYKCPTGVCDTEKAFLFMHANAEKYGFNADRMCAAGESGGTSIILAMTIRL